ncbi:MAG: ATP-binding protein [Nocardioidaceae bacterium]
MTRAEHAPRPDGQRRRAAGVRLRTSAAATGVVALALVGAGAAFIVLQQRSLEQTLTTLTQQQARELANELATQPPKVVADTSLRGGSADTAVVQIVDRHGRVLAASPSVRRQPALTGVFPEPGQERVVRVGRLSIGENEPFLLVIRGVRTRTGDVALVAAQSLESIQQSTSVDTTLLAIGTPLLLIVVAVTSWWITGRALAPVERIRRRVAGITGSDLSERVPVPASDDEIGRLALTMNDMLARLDTSTRAQRRFVADASHELRSPLAGIQASIEVGQAHPDATDWSQTSEDVLAETARLQSLVDDLLLLARAGEGQLAPRREDVDLDDLARQEADRLRRGGAVTVGGEILPVRVSGDPHQLARAVRNLCDNAARHASTAVRLSTYRDLDNAVLEIADDGPGVAVADRERVFERFVRLSDSRQRASGGAGLGLAIVREIAHAHGGEVSFGGPTVPGRTGATVRLRLPVSSPATR